MNDIIIPKKQVKILLVVPQDQLERNMGLASFHASELHIMCPGQIVPKNISFKAAIVPEPVWSHSEGKRWVENQIIPNRAHPGSPIFII